MDFFLQYNLFKTLHIVFVIAWFAGLFYLPRLYVYHASSVDEISQERFKVMERKLFWGIMTPAALLALLFGTIMWLHLGITGTWLHIKLGLVLLLVIYHVWCGKLLFDFKNNRNKHGHVWYRWFNELPVLALIAIVYLVIFKPSFQTLN